MDDETMDGAGSSAEANPSVGDNFSYDSMVDDMAAMLMADETNPTADVDAAQQGSTDDSETPEDGQEDASDGSLEEPSSLEEGAARPPTAPASEEGHVEEGQEQQPELAADGLPRPKGEKANARITQLVAEKNAAKQAQAEAEARAAAAEQRAATTTTAHPDPEAELQQLRERYKVIKTPQQLIDEEMINPLTGFVCTPAEAQAAIAEYKQDLQFQIQEAQAATVERMTQARASESLITTQLDPEIEKLIGKYPELDENSQKYDKDLSSMFQALVDSNMVTERGLVTGFKVPPKEYIASFERMMTKNRTVKVNEQAKVEKNIDKVPSKRALDNRGKDDKISPEDELMGYFDDAMKEMGFAG
jgi:hypothetical protein